MQAVAIGTDFTSPESSPRTKGGTFLMGVLCAVHEELETIISAHSWNFAA